MNGTALRGPSTPRHVAARSSIDYVVIAFSFVSSSGWLPVGQTASASAPFRAVLCAGTLHRTRK
jgi:hypothetical protein